jgi:hypothetical protein
MTVIGQYVVGWYTCHTSFAQNANSIAILESNSRNFIAPQQTGIRHGPGECGAEKSGAWSAALAASLIVGLLFQGLESQAAAVEAPVLIGELIASAVKQKAPSQGANRSPAATLVWMRMLVVQLLVSAL